MTKSKYAVYCVGRVLETNQDLLKEKDVVAVFDKNADSCRECVLNGKRFTVLPPQSLPEVRFDKLLIFSDKYFDEILTELLFTFSVPASKIASWHMLEEGEWEDAVLRSFLRDFVRTRHIQSVLEVGKPMLSKMFCSVNMLAGEKSVRIDLASAQPLEPVQKSFYSGTETSLSLEYLRTDYNLLFISDLQHDDDPQEAEISAKYTIRIGSYAKMNPMAEDRYFFYPHGVLQLKENRPRIDSAKIYVVAHKSFWMPSNDSLYQPLGVGGFQESGWQSDETGDSIAELNPYLNECTGLYWIWKNAKEDYVGLCHYRRYFLNDELNFVDNRLSESRLHEIFKEKKADIILPNITTIACSMYRNIENVVGEKVCADAFRLLREEMQRSQPDYVPLWENQIQENKLFACNMVVASRVVLNAYCEWLFSFLPNAAKRMDMTGLSGSQKRVFGFFSESMMLCWITKQHYRIWSLPVILLQGGCTPL